MKNTSHHLGRERSLRRLQCLAALSVFWCALPSQAAPPSKPLSIPLYTFDADSPQVLDETVGSNDVLILDAGTPTVYIPGEDLGLDLEGDVIDALSANRLIGGGEVFVLLFSVDRTAVGDAPPDAELVAADVLFNALDQADRGHAASDQYLSLMLSILGSPYRAGGTRANNNTLVVNNYNEGGTEFGANPFIPAGGRNTRAAQDNVNSTASQEPLRAGGARATGLYFSTTYDSPSLPALSTCGAVSGATVLYNHDPGLAGTTTYACYDQLGLFEGDEIDALIVVDVDTDGLFGPDDRVLFSLAPGSPSLSQISGASTSGAAADVFIARLGEQPALFASAAGIGLGADEDNIDSLELQLCDDAIACAKSYGIRGHWIPAVRGWGLMATALLLLAAGAILINRRRAAETRTRPAG